MSVLTIAGASLKRMLRDRVAAFFMVLLPLVVILVIGATVGGQSTPRLGVVPATGPLAAGLVGDLGTAGGLRTTVFDGEPAARDALRRNEVDAVLLIPAQFDETLASGRDIRLPLLAGGFTGSGQAASQAVSAAVARHAKTVQAAAFAAAEAGGDLAGRLPLATAVERVVPVVPVTGEVVNGSSDILPAGFTYSAPTMLVLFVFVNSVAAGAALVENRRLGIHTRVLAAPVRARDIILGESLYYLGLALLQSALIVGAGAALFGVRWGDPVAAAALVLTWAVVGTGAGMFAGTLFRTPEQAAALGTTSGVALGMLGGCMWPLEIVPDAVRALGHLTPQAWAVDAWTTLLSRGGGLADILLPLGVLATFAAALLAAASWRLNRTLTA
ncbi:ABC-2 type transport system permease protein [Amycolatopsis tolypomycina]|uniref:ABC-2 type transport system permease protein n=1 Tax=Amycolatopsis tolypomycina TaxID=208445 RepID=A0A1H4U2P5_9PSEU|nr:ABC transporter permease [Amycolatopsis tolypomycina]SEC62989.1 ABC-2 type transport system permease protein [Amycolatopsis tolypomycina]